MTDVLTLAFDSPELIPIIGNSSGFFYAQSFLI
jgi:hypothetical protein